MAIVDSIAPQRSFAQKHVVHIIFSGDLEGRSLEQVTSQDAAVRGHRLFAVGELDDVVLHPPIQRFLTALAAGRPGRVPRPALGALEPAAALVCAAGRDCVRLGFQLVG